MPPKLDCKKPRKYVYYCYRWLPWTTLMLYPTPFWCHLDAYDLMLAIFWCIRHDFASIFHFSVLGFHVFCESVLPAWKGSTVPDIDTKPRNLATSKCLAGNREAKWIWILTIERKCLKKPMAWKHVFAAILHLMICSPLHQFTVAPLHKSAWQPGPAECAERLNSASPSCRVKEHFIKADKAVMPLDGLAHSAGPPSELHRNSTWHPLVQTQFRLIFLAFSLYFAIPAYILPIPAYSCLYPAHSC